MKLELHEYAVPAYAPPEGGPERISAEDKAAWVKALRSGEYKQIGGALQVGDGYCCLGVACRVLPGIKPEVQMLPEEKTLPGGYLDAASKRRLGLLQIAFGPLGTRTSACNVLMTANDDGATFGQIADWIEANL